MNYPVWDLAFGAGLLMALVAVVHVFVSHFAVGGGLFLVLTERKARRENDPKLLAWLKAHTKFFVLVTVLRCCLAKTRGRNFLRKSRTCGRGWKR